MHTQSVPAALSAAALNFFTHTPPADLSSHITVVETPDRSRLNKCYSPTKKEPAQFCTELRAQRIPVTTLEDVQATLERLEGRSDAALVLGDAGIAEPFQFLSKLGMERHQHHPDFPRDVPFQQVGIRHPDGSVIVQRAKVAMSHSVFSYIDIDDIPLDVAPETAIRGLVSVYNELADVRMLVWPSSSTGICQPDGSLHVTKHGLHIYIQCSNPEALRRYFASRKAEFETLGVGTLDLTVFGQSNRIDFGSPRLQGGLTQTRRQGWIREGAQGVFTVDPAWLPVERVHERLDIAVTFDAAIPEDRRVEALSEADQWLSALVDSLQGVQAGGRHAAWRDAAWFVGGAVAAGCLQMPTEEIEARFMTALEGWPGWDDKSPQELLGHLRTGLAGGAEKPCWPLALATKFSRWLVEAGVSPEQLGVRQSLMEYPLYDPAGGAQVYRFESGFMALPADAEQAIRDAQATGRRVTVLMRGPMGVGKTEMAKQIKALCSRDFTAVTPSVSLSVTAAARLGLANYLRVPGDELRKTPALAVCQDSTPKLCPTHANPLYGRRFLHQRNVLVDEVEQVMLRFTTQDKLAEAYRTTEAIMQDAQLLILADASLRESTVEQVNALRPDALVISLIHSGRMLEGRTVWEVAERAAVVTVAQEDLTQGKPVYVATDSKKEAERVYEQLRMALIRAKPEGRAVLITADTRDDEEAKAVLTHPQQARDYDLVVTSPCVSTGIDFTFYNAHGEREVVFERVYAIFGGSSVGAEQAMQMLRRVRDAKEFVMYCNPATSVQAKKDYAAIRERVRQGQFYEVYNYSAMSAWQEWETERYTAEIGGQFMEFELPLMMTITLRSPMYEALATRNLDLRDISRAALRINLLLLLTADGAEMKPLGVGDAEIAETKALRRESKQELAQQWADDRVHGTYLNPNSRKLHTGLEPYSIADYEVARSSHDSGQGAKRVQVDRFLLNQLEPGKVWTREDLLPLRSAGAMGAVKAQVAFELLQAIPEFLRAHDQFQHGMVDLGSRKEWSKTVPLVKHLCGLVGLNLTVQADGRGVSHNFPIIERKVVGHENLPSSAWRWTPTPESVGRLLRAVAEISEVRDLLGLTATTPKQMVTQFKALLKGFGLRLKREGNGRGGHYYILDGFAQCLERMDARWEYVATLTYAECEIVQHLQTAARDRVLEAENPLARLMRKESQAA